MCRIAGCSLHCAEKLDAGEIAAILLPALVRQGPHAYGWMTYNPHHGADEDGIDMQKFAGRSDTDEAWNNIIHGVDANAQWFVGHTRFATHGDPKDLRNDHPIPHGNIIGVHNGVLTNHESILTITGREDPKTQVDSEAIFAAVNKWGPTKGLRRIQGDMVAVYANRRKPHVLHIARTHGRQLTIGFTSLGNMIFASDQSALHLLEPDIKFDHFTTVSENRLLLVRDGKIIQRYTFRKPTKTTATTTRVFTPQPARIVIPTFRGGTNPGFEQWHARRRAEEKKMAAAQAERRSMAQQVTGDAQQRLAERRGKILFPDGMPRKAPIVSKGKRRTANQNRKLRYYDGQLLTETEYQEVIQSESANPFEF